MNKLELPKSICSALFFFFIFTSTAFAQAIEGDTITHYEFKGNVFIEDDKAENVLIEVYDRNNCVSSYQTKKNGKFYFIAEIDKHYTLQFEKEGFITKRVIVKTFNTQNIDNYLTPYKFDITLEKELPSVNYSLHDFPITIIELNKKREEFDFNKKYTKQRLEVLSTASNYKLKN